MGEAESTGTVERQGNPTAFTHTHTHKKKCSMACSNCDDGSRVRVDGERSVNYGLQKGNFLLWLKKL